MQHYSQHYSWTGEPQQPVEKARIKDGLVERKALGASNDRPLMQIDPRNQWSDHAVIPGYEDGIPGQSVIVP